VVKRFGFPPFGLPALLWNCAARQALCALAAFLIAFAVLAWNIDRDGIAAPYLDPIAHTRTQDEALHVNSAIHMARDGGWLTPEFMGRPILFKPPLLIWLSALSIRMLGLSLFAVRLPALLCGAAGIAAVFLWCARAHSVAAGALAASFLLFTPFWQIFSRVCLTDVPAVVFGTIALAAVVFDPRLERARTAVAFGTFCAASILTKSVAGALPLAALALYSLLSAGESRPPLSRIAAAFLVAAALVSPWHIYQACIRPHWFWADYVQVQLLGVGLRSQTNAFFAKSPVFYLSRLARMDPALSVFALAGAAGAMRFSTLRRQPPVLLAFCSTVVTVAALCIFQAKHLPYLAFLLPALCVLGALCGPAILRRPAAVAFLALALFGVKAVASGRAWSLRPATPPMEAANTLRGYYRLGRDVELLLVEGDDEFYSATLPLPRVRYCLLDPAGAAARAIPHYAQLGIVLTAAQFIALPALLPGFEQSLRQWGLDSPAAVGSMILLQSPSEVPSIVRARPGSDFYLPAGWEGPVSDVARTHEVVRSSAGRVFLLSRAAHPRKPPLPAIPAHW
jgi:4-amino-4-deoxy-L-arabinose transferase-like glycosyltransferase